MGTVTELQFLVSSNYLLYKSSNSKVTSPTLCVRTYSLHLLSVTVIIRYHQYLRRGLIRSVKYLVLPFPPIVPRSHSVTTSPCPPKSAWCSAWAPAPECRACASGRRRASRWPWSAARRASSRISQTKIQVSARNINYNKRKPRLGDFHLVRFVIRQLRQPRPIFPGKVQKRGRRPQEGPK